jgi:hypothetical protein
MAEQAALARTPEPRQLSGETTLPPHRSVWREDDPDFCRIRQSFDDVATELAGISARVRVSITAMRPGPMAAEGNTVDHLNVQGSFGIERRAHHLPFTYFTGVTRHLGSNTFLTLKGEPAEPGSEPVYVDEFCESPRPIVRSLIQGNYRIHSIEEPAGWDRPLDFLVATRSRFTMPRDAGMQIMIGSRAPARLMVADIYMHRDLPFTNDVSAGLFYPGIREIPPGKNSRWFDRLCELEPPKLLGHGLGTAGCDGLPRHSELTAWMMAQAGWDPSEFRHFRFQVALPLWALDHIAYFPSISEMS